MNMAQAQAAKQSGDEGAAVASTATRSAEGEMNQVIDRLKNLESLVRDLSGQLEHERSRAGAVAGSSARSVSSHHGINVASPGSTGGSSSADSPAVSEQLGRLVVDDTQQSRFVSSGFWSKINDEVSLEITMWLFAVPFLCLRH